MASDTTENSVREANAPQPRIGKRRQALLIAPLAILLLLLLVAGSLYYYFFEHRTRGAWFSSAGVRLHYTMEGSGPPVILLHGLAINSDLNWRRSGVVRALSDNYRVITLDQRGHLLSRRPGQPRYYGQLMVDDVVRLMDTLGISRAHVIGYSMGGFITLNLVERYPHRLLSATVCGAGWMSAEENEAMLGSLADSLSEGRGFEPLLRFIEPDGEPGRLKMWVKDTYLRRINDQQALAALVTAFPELSIERERLAAIEVPMLAVIGSRDPLRVGVEALAETVEDLEVVVLEGADHTTTPLQSEFPQILRDWLDRQPRP